MGVDPKRPLVGFAAAAVLCAVLMILSVGRGWGIDLVHPGKPIVASAADAPRDRVPLKSPTAVEPIEVSIPAELSTLPLGVAAGSPVTKQAAARPTPTATESESDADSADGATTRSRKADRKGARKAEKAVEKGDLAAEKAGRKAEKAAEKAGRKAEKAAEKAGRKAEKAAEKAGREAEKAKRESGRLAAKLARKAAHSYARAQQKAARRS